jgi:hypothetical protein
MCVLAGAGYELWAFRRIQQNMVAVALFVLVEVCPACVCYVYAYV